MVIDYSKSQIYIIETLLGDEKYIGSTACGSLQKRFNGHIEGYKINRCKETSKILFDKYGIENCYISLYEKYPCSSKEELRRREGEVQREFIKNKLAVNIQIAGRTKKEYRDETKEHKAIVDKEYRKANAEIIAIKRKKYDEINKEKIISRRGQQFMCEICQKEYTYSNKTRHIKSLKHQANLVKNI